MAITIDRHGFHNILVDVDALEDDHAALDAAILLARHSGSKLKIVDCLGPIPAKARSFLTPRLEQELVDDRKARLDRLAYWRCHGIVVETAVLREVAGVALAKEVRRAGHDLLVRAYDRDLPGNTPSLSPFDLYLLRTCPCPLWLVRPHAGKSAPHIAAAVDTSTDDPAEHALNRQILELAAYLRDATHGALTVLHAWHVSGDNLLQPRMAPHVHAEMPLRAERTAHERTAALLLSCADGLGDARLKIVEGKPAEVIPAAAAALHADVLVMGAMVRKGLAGFFMGTTAERVLGRWPGSVVVVKPRRVEPSSASGDMAASAHELA